MSTAEMINHELAACWEMCCEAVGIDTDVTAAEWRETHEDQRAQVQREAAIRTSGIPEITVELVANMEEVRRTIQQIFREGESE